jgi:hypothetical protein
MEIAYNTTNDDGVALLTAPCSRKDPYELKIFYHGFEVVNETIRLGYGRVLIPLKKSVELEKFNWMVTLVDLWGLPLEIDVTPRLTSNAMQISTVILSQKQSLNAFQFFDLIPTTYQLQIQYKSFSIEKEIQIPSKDESLVFPAEFQETFHIFDSRGMALDGEVIQMSRGGETMEKISNGTSVVFSVPPGLYLVKVLSQDRVIGQRSLNVLGERAVDLVTNKEPVFPLIIIALACLLILIGVALGIMKNDLLYFLLVLAVGILVSALILPWWSLQGSSSDIETSSTLYLIPLNLITTTTTSQTIVGERAFFPDIFITAMMLIPVIAAIICLLTFTFLVLNRRNKKRWQTFLLVGALILLLGSLALFVGVMSAFTEVGVGSLIGQGTIDTVVQGEKMVKPVLCQWGPGLGFWLYVLSGLTLTSTLVVTMVQKRKKSL